MYAEKAVEYVGKDRTELKMTCEQWCAEFVSKVIYEVSPDQADVISVSCNTMFNDMNNSKDWYEPEGLPERGDILFFDWDRKAEARPLDHVAVIEDYHNGIVTYINGNGDSSKYVTRQSISFAALNLNGEYPCVYMRRVPKTEALPDNIVTVSGHKYRVTFEEVT